MIKLILDGSAGSYKTTIAKKLSDEFDALLIPEILNLDSMPNAGLETANEAIDTWFFNNEIKKRELFDNHNSVVQDRGFLAHLAFNYSRSKITGNGLSYKRAAERLNAVRSVDYSVYILFIADPEITLNRKLRASTDIWSNKQFLHEMRNWYISIAKTNNIYIIDTDMGFEPTWRELMTVLREKNETT